MRYITYRFTDYLLWYADMGGPDAKIDVDYAVGEMLKIVIPVTSADSGTFRRYDGAVLPW